MYNATQTYSYYILQSANATDCKHFAKKKS